MVIIIIVMAMIIWDMADEMLRLLLGAINTSWHCLASFSANGAARILSSTRIFHLEKSPQLPEMRVEKAKLIVQTYTHTHLSRKHFPSFPHMYAPCAPALFSFICTIFAIFLPSLEHDPRIWDLGPPSPKMVATLWRRRVRQQIMINSTAATWTTIFSAETNSDT